MRTLVFFYGTLMTGFDRRRRAGIDNRLRYLGRGSIRAALFDLGPYPAAVPAEEGRVWGEVYEVADPPGVLAVLDEIEGCIPDNPGRSLYRRVSVDMVLEGGSTQQAWVYFYNGPTGHLPRILSGDYREHADRLP